MFFHLLTRARPRINLVLLIILTFGSRWVSFAMLNPLGED